MLGEDFGGTMEDSDYSKLDALVGKMVYFISKHSPSLVGKTVVGKGSLNFIF